MVVSPILLSGLQLSVFNFCLKLPCFMQSFQTFASFKASIAHQKLSGVSRKTHWDILQQTSRT